MKEKYVYAMLSRMKYINRWGLMQNTRHENLCEHSLDVAFIAHALGIINNEIYGGNINAERLAILGMYHDVTEIITGDLPTPVKYYNPVIRNAYKEVEHVAEDQMLSGLGTDIRERFRGVLSETEEEEALWKYVKAADKMSAYIKCLEEKKSGNMDFADAEKTGDYSAIYADIKSVVDSYNKLYNTLGKTSSSINTMCSDLLKEAVKENSETLSAVGIALKDDGSLSIDEKKLKAADTDTLKKAFGTSSEFAKRLGIIGSNVSSLAKANINYVTNSYTSSGAASNSSDDLYSLMTSKFNSRG